MMTVNATTTEDFVWYTTWQNTSLSTGEVLEMHVASTPPLVLSMQIVKAQSTLTRAARSVIAPLLGQTPFTVVRNGQTVAQGLLRVRPGVTSHGG